MMAIYVAKQVDEMLWSGTSGQLTNFAMTEPATALLRCYGGLKAS